MVSLTFIVPRYKAICVPFHRDFYPTRLTGTNSLSRNIFFEFCWSQRRNVRTHIRPEYGLLKLEFNSCRFLLG